MHFAILIISFLVSNLSASADSPESSTSALKAISTETSPGSVIIKAISDFPPQDITGAGYHVFSQRVEESRNGSHVSTYTSIFNPSLVLETQTNDEGKSVIILSGDFDELDKDVVKKGYIVLLLCKSCTNKYTAHLAYIRASKKKADWVEWDLYGTVSTSLNFLAAFTPTDFDLELSFLPNTQLGKTSESSTTTTEETPRMLETEKPPMGRSMGRKKDKSKEQPEEVVPHHHTALVDKDGVAGLLENIWGDLFRNISKTLEKTNGRSMPKKELLKKVKQTLEKSKRSMSPNSKESSKKPKEKSSKKQNKPSGQAKKNDEKPKKDAKPGKSMNKSRSTNHTKTKSDTASRTLRSLGNFLNLPSLNLNVEGKTPLGNVSFGLGTGASDDKNIKLEGNTPLGNLGLGFGLGTGTSEDGKNIKIEGKTPLGSLGLGFGLGTGTSEDGKNIKIEGKTPLGNLGLGLGFGFGTSKDNTENKTTSEKNEETITSKPEETTTSEPEKTPTSKPEKTTTSKPEKTTNSKPEEATTSKPEKTTSKPEETTTSKPEKTTNSKLEETTTSKPEKTTSKPEETATSEPEKTTTSKPEKTTSKPEKTTTSKPEKTTSKPEETTTSKPEKTTSKPEETTTTKPEKTSNSKPEETTTSKPEKTTSKPEETATSEPEKTTTSKPEKTTSEPEKTTNSKSEIRKTSKPEKTTNSKPEETTFEPKKTTNPKPEKTTNSKPEETTTFEPETTTNSEPEETTFEPEKTTNSKPEETTTSEPEKTTTFEPEKTTTSEPEETTTSEPEETKTSESEKTTAFEPEKSTTSKPEKQTTTKPTKEKTITKKPTKKKHCNCTKKRKPPPPRVESEEVDYDPDTYDAYNIEPKRQVEPLEDDFLKTNILKREVHFNNFKENIPNVDVLERNDIKRESIKFPLLNHTKEFPYIGILTCPWEGKGLQQFNTTPPTNLINFFITTLRAQCHNQIYNSTLNLFEAGIVSLDKNTFTIISLNQSSPLFNQKVLNPREKGSFLSAIFLSTYSKAFNKHIMKPASSHLNPSVRTFTTMFDSILKLCKKSYFERHALKIHVALASALRDWVGELHLEIEWLKRHCKHGQRCFELKRLNSRSIKHLHTLLDQLFNNDLSAT